MTAEQKKNAEANAQKKKEYEQRKKEEATRKAQQAENSKR
jgi:hypothetical protein